MAGQKDDCRRWPKLDFDDQTNDQVPRWNLIFRSPDPRGRMANSTSLPIKPGYRPAKFPKERRTCAAHQCHLQPRSARGVTWWRCPILGCEVAEKTQSRKRQQKHAGTSNTAIPETDQMPENLNVGRA